VADRKRGGGMAKQINLNADMGEGLARMTSATIAGCLTSSGRRASHAGFHAGDPVNDAAARHRGRRPGRQHRAHPGFNDLWGFGRRRIDMNPRELEYMIAYQIGALQAMACYAGAKVTHLKRTVPSTTWPPRTSSWRWRSAGAIKDGRSRHHLCRTRRLRDGEGGARAGAAGGARRLLRPAL